MMTATTSLASTSGILSSIPFSPIMKTDPEDIILSQVASAYRHAEPYILPPARRGRTFGLILITFLLLAIIMMAILSLP